MWLRGIIFEIEKFMPEGPSILLMKEDLDKFEGQKVLSVRGNTKSDKEILVGKTLLKVKTFGKQTYLDFGESIVRIHLMMFGSYSIDEQTRPDKSLRLCLEFKKGKMFFYTCSVKIVDQEFLKSIPWEADVLSDNWDPKAAKKKLIPQVMVCDVLLNQDIFAGVGNIIKNEVLFRIGVQPESLVGNLPAKKLNEMIEESRNYSFDFLNWKREYVLKKHWQVHNRSICPKCGEKLIKKHLGQTNRRSFYCEKDQKLF